MSAYIWVRLARSVSPRAATSSWSNFSFFQPASFQGASDLKNMRQEHSRRWDAG